MWYPSGIMGKEFEVLEPSSNSTRFVTFSYDQNSIRCSWIDKKKNSPNMSLQFLPTLTQSGVVIAHSSILIWWSPPSYRWLRSGFAYFRSVWCLDSSELKLLDTNVTIDSKLSFPYSRFLGSKVTNGLELITSLNVREACPLSDFID